MPLTNEDQDKLANQLPKCEKYVGFLKLSITVDHRQIKIWWSDLDSLLVYYPLMPGIKNLSSIVYELYNLVAIVLKIIFDFTLKLCQVNPQVQDNRMDA